MPTITFQPSGTTIEVAAGTSVFNAAAKAEIAIPSQCGGKCACALCRVCVMTPEAPISPMRWEEEGHLGNAFFLTRERLSCQLQVFGDVTIEIAEAPQKDKKARYIPYSIIRKREQMEREDDQRRATVAGPKAEAAPAGQPRRVPGSRSARRKRNREKRTEGGD